MEPTINPRDTKEIKNLIKKFNLQPHPEGGFYARTFQSTDTVKSSDISRYYNESRYAGTSIYYLLTSNDFSAWHSLKSDEIWHYYRGSPVEIHVIDKNGNLTTHLLGDSFDNPKASFQFAIPAGDWFAAELLDKTSYSLVGCTVSPGFDFKDFTLADRGIFSSQYPQHNKIITRLTRLAVDNEATNLPHSCYSQ